jgi:hypothetical protein
MKFVILRSIYLNGDFMSRKVYSVNYEIEGALSSIAPPFLQIIEDFKNATQVKETAKVHVSVIMAIIDE